MPNPAATLNLSALLCLKIIVEIKSFFFYPLNKNMHVKHKDFHYSFTTICTQFVSLSHKEHIHHVKENRLTERK